MAKALILVADGSEEIEFATPYDGEYLELLLLWRECVGPFWFPDC
jgi:hypothetical protein